MDFLKDFDRVGWNFIFSAVYKFDYGKKFMHMVQIAYTNIQSKIKINGLLTDPFTLMRGVHHGCPPLMSLYIIVVIVLAIFIDANMRIIKGVQIGDHEMEIFSFADGTIIFLRDINCFSRIQSILKLYEKASRSKITFSKGQALWTRAYENRFDKPGRTVWSQFSIKIHGVNCVDSILDSNKWDKINDKLTEKDRIGTECDCI